VIPTARHRRPLPKIDHGNQRHSSSTDHSWIHFFVQQILKLGDEPIFRQATIRGFKAFRWSHYPSLIQSEKYNNNIVKGIVYEVQTENDFRALQSYEGKFYTWTFTNTDLQDGSRLELSRVFIFSGEPGSEHISEFGDGEFEEKSYQQYVVQAGSVETRVERR
jgi:hypothetical protein